jgi:DNA-binding NtrC family response regulator
MRSRILVVDDDASVRETLVANLELDDRFEVIGTDSGARALTVIEREPVDVVLTDVRMPGMNGVELFRFLKQRRPGMPVALMTAFALEGLVQEAVREGAFTVLPKPSSIDAVAGTLAAAARRPFVLVIDDEADAAFATVESLRDAGVRAVAAYDGEAAVHAVERCAIDVCVLDMVMPGLGTEDIVQLIRAQDETVAFIAVLPEDAPASLMRAAAGFEGMLHKPVAADTLLDAVAKARQADLVTSSARRRASAVPVATIVR